MNWHSEIIFDFSSAIILIVLFYFFLLSLLFFHIEFIQFLITW